MVLLVLLIGYAGAARGDTILTPAIPGLCSDAFEPPAVSAPVPLSKCPTTNHDVTIGTGECGPDVYVDQSFTGANGFRKSHFAWLL